MITVLIILLAACTALAVILYGLLIKDYIRWTAESRAEKQEKQDRKETAILFRSLLSKRWVND